MAIEIGAENPLLLNNLARAKKALANHLQGEEEQTLLHEFQVDAVKGIHDAFNVGETAFHIKEATGFGKTAVGLEVARVLTKELVYDNDQHSPTSKHGVAIFVSPLKDLLGQVQTERQKFAPDLYMTNFYGNEKDTNGDIINTTYQSLPTLLAKLKQEGKDVRLAFFDEVHKSLGDVHASTYRDLPQALMIGLSATPVPSSYKKMVRDGKINEAERWTKVFTREAHKVTISEGMARGILSKLDITTITTKVDATNMHIESSGKYSQAQVERLTNERGRTLMGVATVAGLDAMKEAGLDGELRETELIKEAHEKIKGKKTLIYANSLDHMKNIIELLNQVGINAIPYYGEMNEDQRRKAKEEFINGTTNVMVGVKLFGLGLNLPEAEAGIFLVPKRSADEVEQELGRLLRKKEGKERAIAIQFLDVFSRGKAPVLLSQVLDPQFIRDNIELAKKRAGYRRTGEMERAPVITFSGLSYDAIEGIIEENLLIRDKLLAAKNIQEISQILNEIQHNIMVNYSDLSVEEQYEQLALQLPVHLPHIINEIALGAMRSVDSDISSMGRNALLLLNMKTILSAVQLFSYFDSEDIIQEAVLTVLEEAQNITFGERSLPIAQQIHKLVKVGLANYIARNEMVEVLGWITSGIYTELQSKTKEFLSAYPRPTEKAINLFVEELLSKTEFSSINPKSIVNHIKMLQIISTWDYEEQPEFEDEITRFARLEAILEIIHDTKILKKEDAKLLEMAFGFIPNPRKEEGDYSLLELGMSIGVSRERARQRLERARKILRTETNTGRLRKAAQD